MFNLISQTFAWLPGPLAIACGAVFTIFTLLLLFKLIEIMVTIIKSIISVVKTLLISWGFL